MRIVTDPSELALFFEEDREAHLYGLADLQEPFWSNSAWYRDGSAVVGVISTGDAWATGYSMSRESPDETLDLLAEVQGSIGPGTWITGPTGMYQRISAVRRVRDIGPHWRMILREPVENDGAQQAVPLGFDDLDALVDLHDSDLGSSFFLPTMLSNNPFLGIWEEGRLVASAGTHVSSRRYGVAAIGAVITRPSHRGRGLGSQVLAALCRRLVGEYETIGLNVETTNEPALRLYDRLGFSRVFQYEEIEVL